MIFQLAGFGFALDALIFELTGLAPDQFYITLMTTAILLLTLAVVKSGGKES
jgi:hypothetical protein